MYIICTDKKQIFAVVKWRCHKDCEANLKIKEYQLLSPATIDKLKRKVPIDLGEGIALGMTDVKMVGQTITEIKPLELSVVDLPKEYGSLLTPEIVEAVNTAKIIEKEVEELISPTLEDEEEDSSDDTQEEPVGLDGHEVAESDSESS